jgi:ribonuclease-3
MSAPEATQKVEELCSRLGLEHIDRDLLSRALRHASYARELGLPDGESNERLEFLGDAVLDLVLADHLFGQEPVLSEGELTRLKSTLVRQAALARVARRLGLGEFILLARGEEDSGGRAKPSILADTVEALIAAVYLSDGLDAARDFVFTQFAEEIGRALDHGPAIDPKTALQELLQERTKQLPEYATTPVAGPPHEPSFAAECRFRGTVIGRGVGRSKRDAESAAASEALTDPDALQAALSPGPETPNLERETPTAEPGAPGQD